MANSKYDFSKLEEYFNESSDTSSMANEFRALHGFITAALLVQIDNEDIELPITRELQNGIETIQNLQPILDSINPKKARH